MSISSNLSFNTSDGIIYQYSEKSILRNESLIENPFDINIHFDETEQIINDEANLVKLKALIEQNQELNKNVTAFTIGSSQVSWYEAATGSSVVALLLLILLVFFIVYYGFRNNQTQFQILSTVYDNAHGSGAYETLRLSKRQSLRQKAAKVLPKRNVVITSK